MSDWKTMPELERAKADVIASYWAACGYAVKVWTEVETANGMTIHCVKSDLINGLPRDFRREKQS